MWYGWIPILSDRLLPEEGIERLRLRSVLSSQRRFFITTPNAPPCTRPPEPPRQAFPNEVLATIRQAVQPAQTDEVFCYAASFDDLSGEGGEHLIAVAVGPDALVTAVGVFTMDKCECEVAAEVERISPSGLIAYEVTRGRYQQLKTIYCKQVFGIVRDVYHDHVYASSTDFALLPVPAQDEATAIALIFDQYRRKVLDYHQHIRDTLSAYPPEEQWDPELEDDLAEAISSGRGEMVYARSFAGLFSIPDGERRWILRAQNSLAILEQRARALMAAHALKHQHREGFRIALLTVVLCAVAVFSVLRLYWLPPWYLGIPILLVLAFLTWLLVALVCRTERGLS